MALKTDVYKQIEEYCLGTLDLTDKKEFESELERNQELKEEFELEYEVQDAIIEKDISALRNKLDSIAKENKFTNPAFGLLEGFENIQPLSRIVPPEELIQFYDSLPKAHIYQHELFSKENFHEFYQAQNLTDQKEQISVDELNDFDALDEFDGLEDAILEKDILKLRENLSKISESFREPDSTEEIDRYLNHELNGEELEQFNRELAVNAVLRREVELHRELETALLEVDVMNLKGALNQVMERETSYDVSEEQIEDYMDDTLESGHLAQFRSELLQNPGLRSEMHLRQNVEDALGEKNIMALRDRLRHVRKEINIQESKSMVPQREVRHIPWWRAGVAVAVLLFAMAGLFRNTFYSYEALDQSPQWSPQRSVDTNMGILQQARTHVEKEEYDMALALYDKGMDENSNRKFVFQFYKAACLQDLKKYDLAIREYAAVIKHGNNMFVEEAEWYKALITLKTGEKSDAKQQLQSIIDKNGFYANEARAVLRRTRFSFK
jgi:hypothetical protein